MNQLAEIRTQLSKLLDAASAHCLSMRCDEAQAFMLALVSGPDDLQQAEWLPEVLGDHEFSAEERSEIETLLLQLAVKMRHSLDQNQLPELWLYADEQQHDDFFTWCNAYLYALDITPTDWFEAAANEEFEDTFYPLMALAGLYDEDAPDGGVLTIGDKERVQLEAELPHTLQDIARFWQAWKNKPETIRRSEPKLGRNDPCSCGSGKKYKNCCGQQ